MASLPKQRKCFLRLPEWLACNHPDWTNSSLARARAHFGFSSYQINTNIDMLRLFQPILSRKLQQTPQDANIVHRPRFTSSTPGDPKQPESPPNIPPTTKRKERAAGEPSSIAGICSHNHSSATGPVNPTAPVVDEPKIVGQLDPKQHEHVWDKSPTEFLREQVAGIWADSAHDDAGKGKVKTTERGLESPTKYSDWEYDGQTTDFD
jgi:hypothetical protein